VLQSHPRAQARHHLGLGLGTVVLLRGVGDEVVQLETLAAVLQAAMQLPAPQSKRLPRAGLEVEGTLGERGVRILEDGHERGAVQRTLEVDAGQLAQGRQQVLEPDGCLADPAGLDMAGPVGHQRHADAALVEGGLHPAEGSIGAEEGTIHPAVEGRAVVAGEQHQRVLLEAALADPLEEQAEVPVHARDHRRVRGSRRGVREVALRPQVRRLVPTLVRVLGQGVRGHLQRRVRDRRGEVEEEGLLGLGRLIQERERRSEHHVLRVVLAGEARPGRRVGRRLGEPRRGRVPRIGQGQRHTVLPERGRVVVVGLLLAEVPREGVEPLCEGTALVVGCAEAPLPERTRAVAGSLEDGAHGLRAEPQRLLPLPQRVQLAGPGGVLADLRVAGVEPGHQHAARRRADRVPGVGRREAQALGGEAIDDGRPDPLLALEAHLAPTEVVRDPEDHVRGPAGVVLGCLERGECSPREEKREEGEAHGPILGRGARSQDWAGLGPEAIPHATSRSAWSNEESRWCRPATPRCASRARPSPAPCG